MEKVRSSRFAHYVDKLAVPSEPGLTHAQLMLTNHDLKPGLSSSIIDGVSFLSDTSFCQSNLSAVSGVPGISSASGSPIASTSWGLRVARPLPVCRTDGELEYLDGIVVDDHRWAVMVAVLALRLDWIHHIRHLHLHDRSDRRYVPYQLPRPHSSIVRDLGLALACF